MSVSTDPPPRVQVIDLVMYLNLTLKSSFRGVKMELEERVKNAELVIEQLMSQVLNLEMQNAVLQRSLSMIRGDMFKQRRDFSVYVSRALMNKEKDSSAKN